MIIISTMKAIKSKDILNLKIEQCFIIQSLPQELVDKMNF